MTNASSTSKSNSYRGQLENTHYQNANSNGGIKSRMSGLDLQAADRSMIHECCGPNSDIYSALGLLALLDAQSSWFKVEKEGAGL